MNQEPIFICGAHKSGTSLMRSIFDGVESIFTIPIETHFFQNMHFWVNNEYRRERPKRLSNEQILSRFAAFIHRNNSVEDKLSDSMTAGLFDEEKFMEKFSGIENANSRKSKLEIYFSAIYYSIKGKQLSEDVRIVEKSVENAEFAIELSRMFPKAKFIHVVRNPYANFVALRKFKSVKHGYPLVHRLVNTLSNNYYHLYKNQRIIENYKVVKYEELVRNPEKTIKNLSEYLNLPYDKKMLTPTSMGETWTGNSTTGEKYKKISDKNLYKWKKDIHPLATEYVNRMFPFIINDFGYDFYDAHGSFWKPAKGENIPRYIVNRFYKFYLQEMRKK